MMAMQRIRLSSCFGALWLTGTALGCGGFPPAPAYPTKEDGFSAPQQVQRPGLPGDAPAPLTLQPGDLLTLELVSEQPRTIAGVQVDSAGNVHVPLAGDVEVRGLGLSEAEAKLENVLRRYDRFMEVTVQVSDPRGQRVTVLGAVTTQGSIQLVPGARVADVIASAGGPLVSQVEGAPPVPLADLQGAVVTRAGKTLPISVAKALEGDPLHNVYARAGDHIYVPPALGTNISMLGQVGGPRVFPYQAGMRLTHALAMAGGVNVGGDKSDIRVIRGTLEKPRVYQASLADVVDGDSHDVMLQPGDIIFVSDDPIEDIGEVISVISPVLSLGITTALFVTTVSNNNDTAAP
jgi:polysaccharide export outer membrane protein